MNIFIDATENGGPRFCNQKRMSIFLEMMKEIRGPHSDKGRYVAIVIDKTFKVTILFCQNGEGLSSEMFSTRRYYGSLMIEIGGIPIISFEYDGPMDKDKLDEFVCNEVFFALNKSRMLLDKLVSQVHRRRFTHDGIPVSG